MSTTAIRINKYMPIAFLYFFFNSFLLPNGLLYTTLLTPLLLIWVYNNNAVHYLVYYVAATILYALIHFINGVNTNYYLQSYALLTTVVVFVISFYCFLERCRTLRTIFRKLLLFNFAFVLFAIMALFIPPLSNFLWMDADLSYGITDVKRLKLLTYEPSYYSLLLVPLILYYYLKALFRILPSPIITLTLITVPLILSLSFGIILGVTFAMLITFLVYLRAFLTREQIIIYIFGGGALLALGLGLTLILWPDNIFFQRIENVFAGRDSSFKGRTFDSFYLGWEIAKMKSIWFGAGLGQIKALGLELWTSFYKDEFTIHNIAIPNVMAETLAIYGITGAVLRLAIEIYLFFKTKVASNSYRFALFTFAFIYQFTGSYIYNIAEYVVWTLAFFNVFKEFDKKNQLKKGRL